MIKHYLLLAYRNFQRSRSYFFINLFGLTTGLACTLLIFLWVRDELGINTFHAADSRLYEVMENQQYADQVMTTSSTPGILAENLKETLPEVEYAVVLTWVNAYTLSIPDHHVKAKGWHVSSDFFSAFSFPLIQGQPDQVLKELHSIVISRDLAIRLFGTDQNVIGKMVDLQHRKPYQVTGVFSGTPPNSTFQFDFALSFEVFKIENEWAKEWGNNGPSTFVVLREGADAAAFSAKIKNFIRERDKDSNVDLFLQKFSERYLYGRYTNGKLSGGRIEYVQLFSIIAVFILAIACINFMNLSTARASRKAKEVGIKKSIGAQRQSLIIQFITESMLTTILSLLLAIIIVWLFIPQFNIITSKQIRFNLADLQLIGWMVLFALTTGLVAGSYPALYLSAFNPAAVLKGVVKGSFGELWARKGLVVFQFGLSVVLIVSVLVIYRQIQYVQSTNLGYEKDNLVVFPIEGRVDSTRETFIEEVRKIPGVVNASCIGQALLGRNSNTSGLTWDGKDPEDRVLFENVSVGYGMIETLGLEFADGNNFSGTLSVDTSKIIFNEAAIKVMGLKNPVGKTITLWDNHKLEIIGVVKDFHFQSLHEKVNPLFLRIVPQWTWNMMVRLEGGKEKETIKSLTEFYSSYNPGFDFDFQFQDKEYAKLYAAEQRVSTLSAYFAAFAISISCLGLFGLAAFTAERRIKEIGIRKALGSSEASIVLLLSGDFTRMVILAIILGLPVSYWLLKQWLTRFAFHIELDVWYFVIAGILALVIAWLTVASQAVRAARVNPVNCLRTE